ncbi:MAG: CopG family transcriptional regulator [Desulfurococcaceae archaeon]
MKSESRVKEIKVQVPEDIYVVLEELAKKEGYLSVPDYVASILVNLARSQRVPPLDELVEKLKTRLERYLQDELNRRISVVEGLRRQVVELYEKLEAVEQRVSALESSLREVEAGRARTVVETRPRKTAIERLKEEKVLFESILPARVQRDRLFAHFERAGIVVLKLNRERVAVDPDFWQVFKHKLLEEVNSNKEEDVLATLGDKGYELWKALYSDNLLIFDSKTRKWRFLQSTIP